jgi:crotonobetainyl-CoA:carnitine CoA-transferase CaiB-like acyl-CoA transferase
MTDHLLSGYRALDLTDRRGMLCGKLMADMGVDVIKIEPPGGDVSRDRGPFYHDAFHREKSLPWWAENAGKRGVTLNIHCEDGRELFKELAKTADFVIESFDPGVMAGIGLGYEALREIKRSLIMVSITGFGQGGPYSRYKCDDLVLMSMGGMVYISGDPDRPPLRMNLDQAFYHASTQAVAGALMALYHRGVSGDGQLVDVSAQEAVVWITMNGQTTWAVAKRIAKRSGPGRGMASGIVRPYNWKCKDGYVAYIIRGGEEWAFFNRTMVEWMDAEGMADDFSKNYHWESLDFSDLPAEVWFKIEKSIRRFFMSHTKAELYRGAIKRGLPLYPMNTIDEVIEDAQLKARDYWIEIDHDNVGDRLVYPGPFAKFSETPIQNIVRASRIGEHNIDIYCREMGLSRHELITLKQAGVI